VVLTRHGREPVQCGTAERDEDPLALRKAGELVIVENRKLYGGEVKPLTGLANQVPYVDVGLLEVRVG